MKKTILAVLVLAACGGEVTSFSGGTSSSSTSGTNSTGQGGAGQGGSGVGASGGGAGGFDACSGPGQCQLTYNTCCGTCGLAELPDVTAVNQSQLAAYQESLCGDPPPPCPECAGAIASELFAYCDAGSCTAADIRKHELSACQQESDCTLRWNLECCPGCAGPVAPPYEGLVAVRKDAEPSLQALLCDPQVACDACQPVFPAGAFATCDAGHCAIVYAVPAGP